jgi:hypothetical protein
VEQNTQVSEELLQTLVSKYKGIFENRFRRLELSIHFTATGQPPTPLEYRNTPESTVMTGSFVKVGREYRIGINQNMYREAQLFAFFHEYGHAVYRRESCEEINTYEAKIRTETAALLKSLELADAEGLPEIARLAVRSARECALQYGADYQAAMDNVKDNSLWLKYAAES